MVSYREKTIVLFGVMIGMWVAAFMATYSPLVPLILGYLVGFCTLWRASNKDRMRGEPPDQR